MNPIAQRIAALNAKIDRGRRVVAEHRQGARSLHARDVEASKSYVLIHDLYTVLKPGGKIYFGRVN
jgi:hypothetical protein